MGANDHGFPEIVPTTFSSTKSTRGYKPTESSEAKLCSFARIALQRGLAFVHGGHSSAATAATIVEMEARVFLGNGSNSLDEFC
jgi:hypothetical protein